MIKNARVIKRRRSCLFAVGALFFAQVSLFRFSFEATLHAFFLYYWVYCILLIMSIMFYLVIPFVSPVCTVYHCLHYPVLLGLSTQKLLFFTLNPFRLSGFPSCYRSFPYPRLAIRQPLYQKPSFLIILVGPSSHKPSLALACCRHRPPQLSISGTFFGNRIIVLPTPRLACHLSTISLPSYHLITYSACVSSAHASVVVILLFSIVATS